jgi:hypothetical protein
MSLEIIYEAHFMDTFSLREQSQIAAIVKH